MFEMRVRDQAPVKYVNKLRRSRKDGNIFALMGQSLSSTLLRRMYISLVLLSVARWRRSLGQNTTHLRITYVKRRRRDQVCFWPKELLMH